MMKIGNESAELYLTYVRNNTIMANTKSYCLEAYYGKSHEL